MSINPGRYGAKRQSWDSYNPRDLIRDALRENPNATEAEIAETVWETVRNEKGYHRPIFDYWFANNYRHFQVVKVTEHETVVFPRPPAERQRSNSEVRLAVDNAKEEIKAVLMDQTLSTGKVLRDSTFGECRKEGGWLSAIGKAGKANEIVGKKLTEENLWNLRLRLFKEGK